LFRADLFDADGSVAEADAFELWGGAEVVETWVAFEDAAIAGVVGEGGGEEE